VVYQWYLPMRRDVTDEHESKIDIASQVLRERITDGVYVVGQRLPSERELSDNLGVSRITVRSALLRLQADNLIDVVPRGGAFVRPPSPPTVMAYGPELAQAGSFVRAMEEQGRHTHVRFLDPSAIVPADADLMAKLRVAPGTPLLRRHRVHLVEGVPYRILDSYYLASLAGNLLGQDEGYIPLFAWLREHAGVTATRAMERLRVRMPTALEATTLNITRGQPVVDVERLVWGDGTDAPFEFSRIIANAALHEFTYTYPITKEASQ